MRHDNTHECTLDISATVIEPNLDESAEERVAWYNRRGDTSENRIRELGGKEKIFAIHSFICYKSSYYSFTRG